MTRGMSQDQAGRIANPGDALACGGAPGRLGSHHGPVR